MKTESNVRDSQIYNCDETGLGTVPKINKILAHKSQKEGKTITAVIAMSLSGNFVPPTIIFARKFSNLNCNRCLQSLTDALFACNDSSLMTVELFTKLFEHFRNHTKPTKHDSILLVLDG